MSKLRRPKRNRVSNVEPHQIFKSFNLRENLVNVKLNSYIFQSEKKFNNKHPKLKFLIITFIQKDYIETPTTHTLRVTLFEIHSSMMTNERFLN